MARTKLAGVATVLLLACRGQAEEPAAPLEAALQAAADLGEGAPLDPLSKAAPRWSNAQTPPRPDLARISLEGGKATAPTPEGVAELTVDPDVQRAALGVMKHYEIPEASVVLIDTRSGRVLAYANYLEGKPTRDLAALADAPSASVFKIVTGTALVAEAHHTPQDRTCYSGGEHRISASDLEPDPKRDTYCATLAGAMGRSLNTVFARLAKADLRPEVLEKTARSLQYGSVLPFDVPVAVSELKLPADPLDYARTAAGFWNTTLSPVHAAWMSTTLARGGEGIRPHIVARVTAPDGHEVYAAPEAPETVSVMSRETAAAITEMMATTITEGTSTRAFHDLDGHSFLPGLHVSGKTGTLTDAEKQRYYTWFTGFRAAGGRRGSERGDRVARRERPGLAGQSQRGRARGPARLLRQAGRRRREGADPHARIASRKGRRQGHGPQARAPQGAGATLARALGDGVLAAAGPRGDTDCSRFRCRKPRAKPAAAHASPAW